MIEWSGPQPEDPSSSGEFVPAYSGNSQEWMHDYGRLYIDETWKRWRYFYPLPDGSGWRSMEGESPEPVDDDLRAQIESLAVLMIERGKQEDPVQ